MEGDKVLRNTYNSTTNKIGVSTEGAVQQLTTSQDLSADPLSYTSSVGSDFKLNGVFFSFDSTTTQTVSLEYNGVVIFSEVASSADDVFIDTGGFKILGSLSKELTIKCTNTGTPAITVTVTADIEVV